MVSGLPDWHGSINIAKQTLANVDMNINAQALNYVRIKSLYGTTHITTASLWMGPGYEKKVLDVAGEGYLMYVRFVCDPNPESQKVRLRIDLDGHTIFSRTFEDLHEHGYEKCVFPVQLLLYGVDSKCYMYYIFPYPLPFSQSLEVYMRNDSSTNQSFGGMIFYTIV